jgi:hypothetical protein
MGRRKVVKALIGQLRELAQRLCQACHPGEGERGVIRLSQFIDHPPAKVWKALTDPETHAKWWAAGDVKAVVAIVSLWIWDRGANEE